ncbi:hypothetical protein Tco_0507536 [Tanacetum coccineum]
MYKSLYEELSRHLDYLGVEYGRYVVSKVLDTAYRGFLGVGTTFDIFQNILFPYSLNTAYWSFLDTAYWILFPSWSLDFQDSPDDEEDTRDNQEYLNYLEEDFQERALLAKSKRFFKRGLKGSMEQRKLMKQKTTNVVGMVTLQEIASQRLQFLQTHHPFKTTFNQDS